MARVTSPIRGALAGGVSALSAGVAYHDGISFNAETGKVVLKAPGAAPQIVDFATAFPFTRNSPATFRGPSGLIEYANENQIVQSQTFNTTWSQNNLTVSADATAAPDGTVTADKLVEDGTSSTHFTGGFLTIPAGSTHTASIYLKAAERSRAVFYWGESGSPFNRGGMDVNLTTGSFSNLDAGTPTSVTNRTVTDAGNGWWRVSMTVLIDTTSTDGYIEIRIHNGVSTTYLGDGASGIFIWGAQVQRGSSLGKYLATVASAKYDQPRVEYESRTVGTNQLQQSQTFDHASWIRSNTSVLANVDVAPDGSLTADKLVEAATLGGHLLQNTTVTYVAGQVYTFSIYAKAAGRNFLTFEGGALAFGAGTGAWFDLVNGTVGTLTNAPTSTTITNAGNGWWRCSWTKAATITSGAGFNIYPGIADGSASYQGDGVSGVLLWGAQVEVAPSPSVYAPNAGVVVAYTNSTPVCLGLLGEWAGTNLCLQSQTFDNASWTISNSGRTADAAIAPDGTLTADDLVENNASAQHLIQQIGITGLTASTVYCVSMFVRAGRRSRGRLIFIDSTQTDGVGVAFDLVAGTATPVTSFGAGTLTASGIIPYPNGWFRVWVSGAMNNARTVGGPYLNLRDAAGSDSYLGDNASNMFIWGGQLEAVESPTSYIPTTTGALTRLEDTGNRTLGSEYVAGANTVVVRGRNSLGRRNSLQAYWYMSTGGDNIFVGRAQVSDIPRFNAFTTGAGQGPADGGTIVNGSPFKSVATWQAANDMAHSYNGGAVTEDTVATIPTQAVLSLGPTGAAQNGHLLNFDLYNFRIPNERLPLLSAL
jgi:hypothetical protein